jgi:hypothetical protein
MSTNYSIAQIRFSAYHVHYSKSMNLPIQVCVFTESDRNLAALREELIAVDLRRLAHKWLYRDVVLFGYDQVQSADHFLSGY